MDNPLVQPDPGLFIWTIATFLVLLFVLTKFAWAPLLKALEGRQEGIRQSLAEADEARKELARLQEESKGVISQAREEAQSILARTRSESEQLRSELKRSAQAEAEGILRDAEKQLEVERDRVVAEIEDQVVDLSLMVAEKLIKKNLSKEEGRALLQESIKSFEAESGSA